MSRTNTPRCDKPMRSGKSCGRPKGHNGSCRSDSGLVTRAQYDKKRQQAGQAHARHILKTYGITSEQYWMLYRVQGGRCAICKIATGRSKRLAVDHSHKCPVGGHDPKVGCQFCVRGLLCSTCNVYLGRIRESIDAYQRGIDYLKNPPWNKVRKDEGL